jgi:hypothetical protein
LAELEFAGPKLAKLELAIRSKNEVSKVGVLQKAKLAKLATPILKVGKLSTGN